ncbi:Oidioi.mRNA.OKI2018_I69.chr1.g2165.t1.cds [Oikopleura dioica]|uniref:Oidioi.mRNA.OKI2018_I69.chr1.g2165.t1.cds n=1 Tax=Oikopleura dioica TaxID=34765 RepID=A0ABN7SZC9_OIKDI|nr:Oidioi.mRNA.OKI2018_I69.chr1.g2165.t1.cds [Oikopleura dioica]
MEEHDERVQMNMEFDAAAAEEDDEDDGSSSGSEEEDDLAQEQYEMDIAFDMIEESDGGDTENDFEGEFTEISITLSDYSPTGGSCFVFARCESPVGSII